MNWLEGTPQPPSDSGHTQKKQVFKNKRKNASYVSILFLKNFILCFSNPLCGVFYYLSQAKNAQMRF